MTGKSHSAQGLTIKLLKMFDISKRAGIYVRARQGLSGNESALAQLELCMMFSGDPVSDLGKYEKDFVMLAKTILARGDRSGTDPVYKITLDDIGRAMGFSDSSAAKLVRSIQDRSRELRSEEIDSLCNIFRDDSNRQFWKNQIYLFFPDLPAPDDVIDGPALVCLQAIWNCLPDDAKDTARLTFPSQEIWFLQLDHQEEAAAYIRQKIIAYSSCNGLYDLLETARMLADISREEIADQFGIETDTYRNYEKIWGKYESGGCQGPFPKRRLSRERLLFLAVYLNMDYFVAVTMLAMGCYCFHSGEPDITVARYLLGLIKSRDDVLKKLHPTIK